MAVLGQLVIMHLNQTFDGLLDGLHLQQRHLVVLGEKLEALHRSDVLEGFDDLVFHGRRRDVGEVQSRRRRENVRIVLAARLLEAMQSRIAEIFRQAGIRLTLLGHLHLRVFRSCDTNLFAP